MSDLFTLSCCCIALSLVFISKPISYFFSPQSCRQVFYHLMALEPQLFSTMFCILKLPKKLFTDSLLPLWGILKACFTVELQSLSAPMNLAELVSIKWEFQLALWKTRAPYLKCGAMQVSQLQMMCHLEHFFHFIMSMIFCGRLIFSFMQFRCSLKLRFLSIIIPRYLYESTIGIWDFLCTKV